jgi:hypothetical protein
MLDSPAEAEATVAEGYGNTEFASDRSLAGTRNLRSNSSINRDVYAEQVEIAKKAKDCPLIGERHMESISKVVVCPICLNLDCTETPRSELDNSGNDYLRLRERRLLDIRTAGSGGCGFCAILQRLCQSVPMIKESSRIDVYISFSRGKMMAYITSKTPDSRITYHNFELYQPIDSIASNPLMSRFPKVRDIAAEAGSDICFGFAKSCLDDCIKNHELCRELGGTPLPNRTIYLGAGNSSLKLIEHPRSTFASYAALSYCWGTGSTLKTTRGTLSSREARISWNSLPPVFQDAIAATRKLGVEHLWIDALCIIQDSPEDWQIQSSKMADIFAGATFTIAAVSSENCNMPFLISRPECYSKPLTIDVDDNKKSPDRVNARSIVPVSNTNTGPLNSRAWAYQERVLSTRVLGYMAEELIWQCRMGMTCECQTHIRHAVTTLKESYFDQYYQDTFQKVANANDPRVGDAFLSWQVGVGSYTSRALTYPSDRLPALAGVADVVHKRTGSSYVAGLWRDNLLGDLQWQIAYYWKSHNDKIKALDYAPAPLAYQAPSFSWASLNVRVHYRDPQIFPGWSAIRKVQYESLVRDAHCNLKGLNTFGEVTDGFIKLEGPVFRQTLLADSVSQQSPSICLLYEADAESDDRELTRQSYHETWPGYSIYADAPLCEVVRQDMSKTVRRLRTGEACMPFRAPVYCLGLYRIPGRLHVALMLGESVMVPGAYERLGILRWFVTEAENPAEELEAISRCYKGAEIKVVTIV